MNNSEEIFDYLKVKASSPEKEELKFYNYLYHRYFEADSFNLKVKGKYQPFESVHAIILKLHKLNLVWKVAEANPANYYKNPSKDHKYQLSRYLQFKSRLEKICESLADSLSLSGIQGTSLKNLSDFDGDREDSDIEKFYQLSGHFVKLFLEFEKEANVAVNSIFLNFCANEHVQKEPPIKFQRYAVIGFFIEVQRVYHLTRRDLPVEISNKEIRELAGLEKQDFEHRYFNGVDFSDEDFSDSLYEEKPSLVVLYEKLMLQFNSDYRYFLKQMEDYGKMIFTKFSDYHRTKSNEIRTFGSHSTNKRLDSSFAILKSLLPEMDPRDLHNLIYNEQSSVEPCEISLFQEECVDHLTRLTRLIDSPGSRLKKCAQEALYLFYNTHYFYWTWNPFREAEFYKIDKNFRERLAEQLPHTHYHENNITEYIHSKNKLRKIDNIHFWGNRILGRKGLIRSKIPIGVQAFLEASAKDLAFLRNLKAFLALDLQRYEGGFYQYYTDLFCLSANFYERVSDPVLQHEIRQLSARIIDQLEYLINDFPEDNQNAIYVALKTMGSLIPDTLHEAKRRCLGYGFHPDFFQERLEDQLKALQAYYFYDTSTGKLENNQHDQGSIFTQALSLKLYAYFVGQLALKSGLVRSQKAHEREEYFGMINEHVPFSTPVTAGIDYALEAIEEEEREKALSHFSTFGDLDSLIKSLVEGIRSCYIFLIDRVEKESLEKVVEAIGDLVVSYFEQHPMAMSDDNRELTQHIISFLLSVDHSHLGCLGCIPLSLNEPDAAGGYSKFELDTALNYAIVCVVEAEEVCFYRTYSTAHFKEAGIVFITRELFNRLDNFSSYYLVSPKNQKKCDEKISQYESHIERIRGELKEVLIESDEDDVLISLESSSS